ncbi:MAG: hypothetical protein WCL00_13475, partial [Bacteroidota bacterium]
MRSFIYYMISILSLQFCCFTGYTIQPGASRVNPLTTPTIMGEDTTCAGDGGYIYTTDAGMTGYVWTVSAGGEITSGGTGTSSTATITWNSAGTQSVSVTFFGASGTTTLAITVLVKLPVSLSIAASDDTVCEGTPVTLTATGVNGGGTPTYVWKVNAIIAGSNSPVFTYVPTNGDLITCLLTSSERCTTGNPALSNSVLIIVQQNSTPAITISSSGNPVCQGSQVTFTAIAFKGGASPGYQWKVNNVNAGTNIPTYSYTPINGDIVKCVLTSNIICPSGNPATSNPITMIVSPIQPVNVTIIVSANPSCLG